MTEVDVVPTLHVRALGRSFDYPLSSLDIGDLSTDNDIRAIVSAQLAVEGVEAPISKLANFEVDRSASPSITVRPQAVFG